MYWLNTHLLPYNLGGQSLKLVSPGLNPGVGRAVFVSGGSKGESVSLHFLGSRGFLYSLTIFLHLQSQQHSVPQGLISEFFSGCHPAGSPSSILLSRV